MKRGNRNNSYERGGQVELAKAMGNVAKKGDKEINEGRVEIKSIRKDIENYEKDISNFKRGIDERKNMINKKDSEIKLKKKDMGGIYNTVQDAKKQQAKFAKGGMSEKGKNGYIAFYKGKKMEVYADSSFQAREKAAKSFKARKSYDVNVVLAEKDGKQVTHYGSFAKGGKISKAWDKMYKHHTPKNEDEDTQVDFDLRELMDVYLKDNNKNKEKAWQDFYEYHDKEEGSEEDFEIIEEMDAYLTKSPEKDDYDSGRMKLRGQYTEYPFHTFTRNQYDFSINAKTLAIKIEPNTHPSYIKERDIINDNDLNDIGADWEKKTGITGYMVYPKNEKQLYDVLKALKVSVSKKRLGEFVKDGCCYAKGGSLSQNIKKENMKKEYAKGGMFSGIKEGKKVEIADYYIDDEVGKRAEATSTAIILSEPSDDEELVMVQYTNGAIDYVPQDVIEVLPFAKVAPLGVEN